MKNKIKNTLLLVFTLFLVRSVSVNAASINGNKNVKGGDEFTLTYNFGTSVGAYDSLKVDYSQDILEYVSGDSLSDEYWYDSSSEQNGITSKSYTFRAKKSGNATVSVNAKGVVDTNLNPLPDSNFSSSALITVKSNETVVVPSTNTNSNTTGNVNTTKKEANGNNYLKYLQISEEGLTPYFSRNVIEYSLAVSENVTSIDVLARAEDSNARVEVTGNDNIVDGENKINIKVTAENGYYRIYTITVTKTQNKETSNAYLENLLIENYNLDKEFQSEVTEYDIGEILSTTKSLNVVAIAKDQNAKIEIDGADSLVESGDGYIVVKVTAPDGVTTKEYKIKYNVKEATVEQENDEQMNSYLKDIENSTSTKEKAKLYLKYIWAAIKKNYLLVIMYIVIIFEFIQILRLRKKANKPENNPPTTPKKMAQIDRKNNERFETIEDNNTQENTRFIQSNFENNSNGLDSQNFKRRGNLNRVDSISDDMEQFENLNEDKFKEVLSNELDNNKEDSK